VHVSDNGPGTKQQLLLQLSSHNPARSRGKFADQEIRDIIRE
jgi:hypothetical protein